MESNADIREVKEDGILENERVSKLLIHSFRLSQGDPKLQGYIFQYLHLKYPKWKIFEDQFDPIIDLSMPIIEQIVFKAKKLPQEETPYTLHTLKVKPRFEPSGDERNIDNDDLIISATEQLEVMMDIINGAYRRNPKVKESIKERNDIILQENINFTMHMIQHYMKERDDTFVERGRTMRQYDHYVVGGHSTGVPEYDQMMRDVKSLDSRASLVSR